jgi:hypothetical protein
MFRTGATLAADFSTIASCLQSTSDSDIKSALSDLISWKILIERKHIGAYGVYAGSDFDVEGSINQARNELSAADSKSISGLSDLNPVIAKKLYHEKGTMYWFTKQIITASMLPDVLAAYLPVNGSIGTFFLCLPDSKISEKMLEHHLKQLSKQHHQLPVVLGYSANVVALSEISLELSAAEKVMSTRTELEGDSVARRELLSRIGTLRQVLQDELTDAFRSANWFFAATKLSKTDSKTLSSIASEIASNIFSFAPRINNELLNREELSSNVVKARKDLMKRMIDRPNETELGYEGYPADAGIYYSLLHATQFHKARLHKRYAFGKPTDLAFAQLWDATENLIQTTDDFITLTDVYRLWQAPPFGIKKGVLPVLALNPEPLVITTVSNDLHPVAVIVVCK